MPALSVSLMRSLQAPALAAAEKGGEREERSGLGGECPEPS